MHLNFTLKFSQSASLSAMTYFSTPVLGVLSPLCPRCISIEEKIAVEKEINLVKASYNTHSMHTSK
jgi:hypothetical protein